MWDSVVHERAARARRPGRPVRPHPVLPGQAGHRARGVQLSVHDRLQHRGQPAVRRPRHGPVLHARPLHGRGAGHRGQAARELRRGRRLLPHGLADPPGRREDARPADGEQVRALPERPAVPGAQRRAAGGDRRRGLQPHRVRGVGRLLQHPLPPHSGHQGHQGGGRGEAARHRPRGAGRAGGPRPVHAGPLGRPVQAAQRPDHQHPPLLPAELQGRQAVPPGARPRRQADRRHRALRDGRPRRGADHRAGGRARPPRRHPGPAGGHRPGRGVPGAGPCGEVARGAPDPAERAAHGRLRLSRFAGPPARPPGRPSASAHCSAMVK
ncbi:Formyltetrahydrofolate deformylase [Streptomyces misionensis JCM 4497]